MRKRQIGQVSIFRIYIEVLMRVEGCIAAENVLVADHDCLWRACGSTCVGEGETIVRFAYYLVIVHVL